MNSDSWPFTSYFFVLLNLVSLTTGVHWHVCKFVVLNYFLNFVKKKKKKFVCSYDCCAHFVCHHCFFLLYGIVSL